MAIKVAINGYGTIGKRVADAVSLQDDMRLVGASLTKPSFKAVRAAEEGYDIYVPAGQEKAFGGMKIKGSISEMIGACDLVVDASPEGVGEQNRALYRKAGKKAIFQGGEEHELVQASFNANANYDAAKGKDFVRVVSCNTTGLCRTLNALKPFGIENAYAVIVRRGADPGDSKTGPINAIIPETHIPSHHGADVQTVIPNLPIVTAAVKVPTTIMHVHVISVRLKRQAAEKDILGAFESENRVMVVESGMGLKSTAEIMELARDMGRKRSDLYEIAVWKESVNVKKGVVYFMQAVHQESGVVPENIDAIRAMFSLADREKSISKTNKTMGIR